VTDRRTDRQVAVAKTALTHSVAQVKITLYDSRDIGFVEYFVLYWYTNRIDCTVHNIMHSVHYVDLQILGICTYKKLSSC